MYQDTVTVFNRHHDKSGDVWFPRILHNVDLIVDRASMIAKYGAESNAKAKLHVKYVLNDIIENRRYIAPKKWEKLTEAEKENYITFNSDGNYFDFFMVGEFSSENPVKDNDFENGFFDNMNDDFECYVVSSASRYTAIPHFEIVAE